MEVHMNGIPPFLPTEKLHQLLEPIMARLRIDKDEYVTDKPRKATWANLTFHNLHHGQAFLDKHGEQWVSRRLPRLQLMGHDVFCKQSKRPPEPITMRALQYTADEKIQPTRKIQREGAPEAFTLRALSCGLTVFHGDRLVFSPEVEYRGFEQGSVATFSKKLLIIKFQQGALVPKKIIRISLDTVVTLIHSPPNLLTLTLSEEPSFFQQEPNLASLFSSLKLTNSATRDDQTRTRICNLDEQHKSVVGQCLVYQLEIDIDVRKLASLEKNIPTFVRYSLLTPRTAPQLANIPSSANAMAVLMQQLIKYTQTAELPFDFLYQLQALAWNAYLHPSTVSTLAEKLIPIVRLGRLTGTPQISIDAMKRLFKTIAWPEPHGDSSAFMADSIIKELKNQENEHRKESAMQRGLSSPTQNLASVFRITVTPSRTTLHGPEYEANNRVLRKFSDQHEYFARVQFCDENGQDLYFNGRISYEQIYARYKHVLNNGIQIAGRVYRFLGFSHSSLRSHSAWFSAPFLDKDGRHQSYEVIMKDLGDFSDIRCPARCAARIGQAFSETPFSVDLDDLAVNVRRIPDVTSADGSRVFSDGVGTVSQELVYGIWEAIPQSKAAPTAFQIRFQGAKGMLALDTRQTGSVMCLRKSMVKFQSEERRVLEICDTASKPIPLYLNRQMIKILEDMGVNNAWFLQMQGVALSQLRAVTDSAYNVAQFLQQQNIGEGIRFYRFFRQLANMGIDYRKEPFLCSIVEASLLRELRLLKHKARISIQDGITLFGIMDETGYLKEGQVYVTFDTMNGRFAPPPGDRRKLVVTRSPALHPGDIQIAVQKIPPVGHPLREHYNVIVFSRHGARDLPSQLSGGDLDGDIYNVIWDMGAMPRTIFQPADYPRVEPTDLGRKVEKEDMTQFFVDFMKLDHLGVIATRHMILADQRDWGTNDPDCLKLAELHSKAVDFSKNGHSVDLRDLPRAKLFRPDFLAPGNEAHIVDRSAIELDEYILEPAFDEEEAVFANPRHKFYRSPKILGQLYRAINEQEVWNNQIKAPRSTSGSHFWSQFLAAMTRRYEAVVPPSEHADWVAHQGPARELREIYEVNLAEAMTHYSEHPVKPITEIEVFIGNILNRTGVQTSRQRDNSTKLKDSFDHMAQWITKSMRRVRHDKDVPLTGYQTKFDNLHLCLACVHVGGQKDAGIVEGRYFRDLQSFRVVAACALLAELNLFDGGGRGGAGGFVGVKG